VSAGLRTVLGLAAVAALPLVVRRDYYLGVLILVGIYAMALLGLDLIKGSTGLLSLGQAGFMGVAAYTSAILTTRYGWEPLAALPVAAAVVVVVAAVMAVPGSRLTGFNLALATLGFVIITEGLFLGLRQWTGGASGITGVPPFRVGRVVFASARETFWLVWGVCAALVWVTRNLTASPLGQALRAIKQDELAAATLGIDVFRCKVWVFLIAAGYSALAGSLFAHYMQFISPDMVNWVVSTSLVTMLVLGGEGSLWGVFLGAALLRLVPEVFNPVQNYLLIVQGLVLILVMVYLPGGLWSVLAGLPGRRPRAVSSGVAVVPGPVGERRAS
jgi:branched-chain amino acid transport system permease protein